MTSNDSSLDGGRIRSQYWSGWPEFPQTKHTLFVTLVVSCFKYMPSLVQRVSCAITPLRVIKQRTVKGSAYPSAGRTDAFRPVAERRFGTEPKDHGIRCMYIGGRGQMLPADTCVSHTAEGITYKETRNGAYALGHDVRVVGHTVRRCRRPVGGVVSRRRRPIAFGVYWVLTCDSVTHGTHRDFFRSPVIIIVVTVVDGDRGYHD